MLCLDPENQDHAICHSKFEVGIIGSRQH